ncbi:ABC transporter permease [Spiroplasma endosymbiont of Nephrotoma flavescens]|uniref:ABC transporter permease n=1 Tax=Spiroplasma endosymbiont of Nephrotoma flavescens TaxID=3066302 RepID=UPI00313CD38B
MFVLLKNSFRSIKKRFLQYIGLLILLVLAISIFSAMFANNQQITSKYDLIYKNSLRPTHRISKPSELKLINDSSNTTIDLTEHTSIPFENNNAKLMLMLAKLENEGFNCQIENQNKQEPFIDPMLCSIHLIVTTQNKDSDKVPLRETSIRNWRILMATNSQNIKSSLFFKGRIQNNNGQEFDIVPSFDLENIGLINNNPVSIVKGRIPIRNDEIVISETYSYVHNIKINDSFIIKNNKFIVVGFGNSYTTKFIQKNSLIQTVIPEQLSPKDNGVIYTTLDLLFDDHFRNDTKSSFENSNIYLTISGDEVQAQKDIYKQLKEKTLIEDVNKNFIKVISDELISNLIIQSIVFIALTFISMSALVLIVSFFIRKEINDQRTQIGILKSFGYKGWQISFNFIGSIFIITSLAAILGFGISLLFQKQFSGAMLIYNFGIVTIYFDIKILLIFFIFLPLLFTFVCWGLTTFLLRMPVLQLIYASNSSNGYLAAHFFKSLVVKFPFSFRLSVAFFTKSFGKWLVSGSILLLASFILFLQYLTVDTMNHKIDSFHSEWKVAGSNSYNEQYRNITDYDQFNANNTKQSATTAYFYNQQYEYIALQDIIGSQTSNIYNHNSNREFAYYLVDWQDEEIKPDTKKATIYRVFNTIDNEKLKEIFAVVEKIVNENPNISLIQIFQKLNVDKQNQLMKWFNRLKALQIKIPERYKFNVSSDTIAIILKNRKLIIELSKKIPSEFNFKDIMSFLNIIDDFKNTNINIENIDLTLNYVEYDNTQDYLMNRYYFNVPTLNAIQKINSGFNAFVYGVNQKSFQDILNIKHSDQYIDQLYFNNPNDYNAKRRILPVLVSRSYAEYYQHQYQVSDIINNFNMFWIKDMNIKIVGIIDNATDGWTIVTNEKLIAKYFVYREAIKNGDNYDIIDVNKEGNDFQNNNFYNFIMGKNEVLQPLRSMGLYYERDSIPIVTIDSISTNNNKNNLVRPPLIKEEPNIPTLGIKNTANFNSILIIRLAKDGITNLLNIISSVLDTIRYVTLVVVIIVLILLVSMIIDDNVFIIATMKILGYHIKQIVSLIIGWYLIAVILFFAGGVGLSFLTWYIVGAYIFKLSGIMYLTHISLISLLLTVGIVLFILLITYFISIFIIQRKDVLILQKTS